VALLRGEKRPLLLRLGGAATADGGHAVGRPVGFLQLDAAQHTRYAGAELRRGVPIVRSRSAFCSMRRGTQCDNFRCPRTRGLPPDCVSAGVALTFLSERMPYTRFLSRNGCPQLNSGSTLLRRLTRLPGRLQWSAPHQLWHETLVMLLRLMACSAPQGLRGYPTRFKRGDTTASGRCPLSERASEGFR
jgi:hypothetical protein